VQAYGEGDPRPRRRGRISRAGAATDLRADLDPLDSEWQEVDWQGHKAGLKACADHRLWAYADDWGTPVFVREYGRFLRRVDARISTLNRGPKLAEPRVAARYFARIRALANTLDAEFGSYSAPYAVLKQAQAYEDALYRLWTVADQLTTLARRLTMAQLRRRPMQRLERASTREFRTRAALADAVRALRLNAPAPDSEQSS
jgi:hypothetical protein